MPGYKRFSHKELLISLLLVALLAAMLIPGFFYVRNNVRRVSCQNNLKHMGLVCKMYANESEGMHFPPVILSGGEGFPIVPIPDPSVIYPEYLSDLKVLACPESSVYSNWKQTTIPIQPPSDSAVIPLVRSYHYYSWVIDKGNADSPTVDVATAVSMLGMETVPKGFTGSEQVPSQLVAIYQAIQNADEYVCTTSYPILERNYKVAAGLENEHGDVIFRLRECFEPSIPRVFEENWYQVTQSATPIMWDTPGINPEDLPHVPGGLNVLFMDGHVEFIAYPSDRFPVTEGMAVWSRLNEALLFGDS